jgi:hypothetical protein
MAKAAARLVTEHTDTDKTVRILEAGVHRYIEETGDDGALARLTVKEVNALIGVTFFALGEVFERQFYPSDREQCQEVAREFHRKAGLPVPGGTIKPAV